MSLIFRWFKWVYDQISGMYLAFAGVVVLLYSAFSSVASHLKGLWAEYLPAIQRFNDSINLSGFNFAEDKVGFVDLFCYCFSLDVLAVLILFTFYLVGLLISTALSGLVILTIWGCYTYVFKFYLKCKGGLFTS